MSAARVRVLLLMLTDLVCIAGAFLLVAWFYRVIGLGHYKFGLEFYLRLWPAAVAFIAVNGAFRLYHGNPFYPAAPVDPIEELRRLIGSSLIVHAGTLAALALAYQTTEHYSRAVIAMSAAITAVCAQPMRNLARLVMARFGIGQMPVDILGDATAVARLAAAVRENAYLGFRLGPVGSGSSEVALVCPAPDDSPARRRELCGRYCYVEFVSSAEEFPAFGSRIVSLGGCAAQEVANQRKMAVLRAEKRMLDMVLSVLVFLLTLPLFAVISVLVALTSRGPVFFRHERLGKKGRPIRVWKFRSMYVDAEDRLHRLLDSDSARQVEWARNFKLADDPRVTPLGRFLRKTSIDELPQLFNVFAGEMALVGPRPIVEKEVPLYGDAYETFSSVKPGITGLWQASGRSDTDYARRVALDVQYVLNWSPWMDIWILFRTVGAVFLMRGAR